MPAPLVEEAKRKWDEPGSQAPADPESGTVVLDSESDCIHLWVLVLATLLFPLPVLWSFGPTNNQLHPWDTAPVSNSVSIFVTTRVKIFISWTYKEEWLVSPAS